MAAPTFSSRHVFIFAPSREQAARQRRRTIRGGATPKAENCVRWPVSRVLFLTEIRRWPFLWDVRCRTPRATYPDDDPETDQMPSLFGLAPGGACRAVPVARTAVRSYRTFSTLPLPSPADRRFDFCGAIPGVAPGGCYPSPCFRGARTFLPASPFGLRRGKLELVVVKRAARSRAAIRPSDADMIIECAWSNSQSGRQGPPRRMR